MIENIKTFGVFIVSNQKKDNTFKARINIHAEIGPPDRAPLLR